MKKLLSILMFITVLILVPCKAIAQPAAPNAEAYILIDSITGEVLCEKNSDKSLYPASTTKIMTAILALEMGDLSQVMTASQAAIKDIGPNGSNIGIIPGEKIELRHLLQALLISSANETANIIAENLCENRKAFIELMNKKAAELGATGTHFSNASGIHDPEHYTTASDMARFARYAMTFPVFREIVSTRSFTMPPTNKHPEWPPLTNTNKLMLSDKSDIYVINGIKTGFTGPAGYNLVSSAKDKNGMELISVVMGVKNENASENVQKYSKELLDYGFNNFEHYNLMEKGKTYRNVKVEEAPDPYGLDLLATESLTCILPKSSGLNNIKEIPHINTNIYAPVNKGDVMGYVEFYNNDVLLGKINLVAARDIERIPEPPTLKERITNAINSIYVKIALPVAGFLVFFLLLRITLRYISRNIRRKRSF